ncbi:MAG: GNAT family N-acetyltransferase [Tindallia sp. MSAO_Bac2]|nr:MAG: GNAT family N-acetyltransferase [Tindallia sp. MSAO_Bac2]
MNMLENLKSLKDWIAYRLKLLDIMELKLSMREIRRLRKSDIRLLFHLMETVNHTDNLNLTLTREWFDYVLELDNTGNIASFERERMTGLATCMINEVFPEQATVNVLVHPDYRRKGLGEELLDWVLDFARENGVASLETYVKKGWGTVRPLPENLVSKLRFTPGKWKPT